MRSVLVFAAILFTAAPAAAQLDGAFTLRQSSSDDRLHLNLQQADGRSNYGRTFERSAFSDVKESDGRITFALRRAAGTFSFEGRGSMQRASGWYGFAPNAEYKRDMERAGFAGLDDRAVFVLALQDMTVDAARRLQSLVSDTLDSEKLVRLLNHGAGLPYVQQMNDAGFRKLSSDEYRRARDHGVSADYAREMSSLGIKLPLEELVRLRDHGVSVDFVRGMREAGHDVPPDELRRARDHGVTPDYLRRMRDAGLKGLELREYVRLRDHGVTPDYVTSIRDAGLSSVSAADYVRLRNHGVSAAYVRKAKELFKEGPTVEQIIRLRTRGDLGR